MNARPILFSAPMVRALLDGRKLQTRRLIHTDLVADLRGDGTNILHRCPYGQPGDLLWVRESLAYDSECGHYYAATGAHSLGNPSGRVYVEDTGELPDRRVNSIHMPRWASRLTLRIIDVRVERLQEISEADAKAEGIAFDPPVAVDRMGLCSLYRKAFQALWESLYGPDSWDANPWVWVITFDVIHANVDQVLKEAA